METGTFDTFVLYTRALALYFLGYTPIYDISNPSQFTCMSG